jgi:hypothetical protein
MEKLIIEGDLRELVGLSQLEERFDFSTHLKYADRLDTWSSNLSMTCSVTPKPLSGISKELKDKSHLIVLTKKSLDDELAIVQEDAAYSTASVLWLPSKAYYLLYHQLSLIEYLLTEDKTLLRMSHKFCLERFSDRLSKGELVFSHPPFNFLFDKKILEFKTQSGEHLRNDVLDDVMHKLIMKKVAMYKCEDYKVLNNIDRKTAKGKKEYQKCLDKLSISILDFFYTMRIKSAYKDFAFIDGIDPERTKLYFNKYYAAIDNFYGCLDALKNELIAKMA